MDLTDEQHAIVAGFRHGSDLRVTAGAGTGKTSTLVEVAATAPTRRVLYLAFNKSVQVEASRKFGRNVKCSTIHSLAYQSVGSQFRDRLNGPRVPLAAAARVLGLNQKLVLGQAVLSPARLAGIAMETVARFAGSASPHLDPIHVPVVPGVPAEYRRDVISVIVPAAERAWQDMSTPNRGQLRTTHDVYLKVWAMRRPQIGAEVILYDEAQDTTGVTADVMRQQKAAGARLVVVGDSAQAIYGWRGAIDALDMFGDDLKGLSLTQSFRFGPAIADLANEWLQYLGQPLRLRGHVPLDSSIGPVPEPDAILCRSNGGVMSEVLTAQMVGRAVAVLGGAQELERLAAAAADLKNGRTTNHPELAAFTSWADVQDYANTSDGRDLKALVNLIDSHGSATIISAVTRTVPEDTPGALVVSTVHRAKGREWDRVRIASDFLPPDDDAPRQEQIDEGMLAYVAVTRAKKRLDPGLLRGPKPQAAPTGRSVFTDPWSAPRTATTFHDPWAN